MASSAGSFTSASTALFTSSGVVSTEEQPVFSPVQQAWIHSLVADMAQCDPSTSTMNAATLTAVSLLMCNSVASRTSGGNICECIATYVHVIASYNDSMSMQSRGSYIAIQRLACFLGYQYTVYPL